MRVGISGCRLLLLGSVAASLLAGPAQAARFSDRESHSGASRPATSSATRVAASRAAPVEREGSAHRGGGSKTGHGGGFKSSASAFDGEAGRPGFRTAIVIGSRFGYSSRFAANPKARIFAGSYNGGYASRFSGESSGGYRGYGVIQCVAFARADTGIEISGNATNWWGNAAGRYARGSRPEPGSVLNFRSTGGMPLGHVAVVSSVVGPREVMVDHAHWGGPGSNRGGIARGTTVIDVSPTNDWSQVRVSLGSRDDYGSTYPTYGFIYNRADNGLRMADSRMPLRSAGLTEEVAEAPVRSQLISLRPRDEDDAGRGAQ